MREHELKHHGIYGQKCGIRRFQNADGSLTPAGRKRYGVGEKGTIDDISTAKGMQKRLNDVANATARNARYERDYNKRYKIKFDWDKINVRIRSLAATKG